jgi:serine/threonine protein kinase
LNKSEKELKNLKEEIEILRSLHHENIIQLLDSYETDKEVVVVTEYADGELFSILEDDKTLEEEQVRLIACQLISALYYLHSHRILHRDMKPQNILLCKDNKVKLCDFGFARAMSVETMVLTSIKGTPLYMSPELVEDRPYDHNSDLWALGCILYEINYGTPPFYTNNLYQLVEMIVKSQVKWPKSMSPVFKNFLQGLLVKDASKRLSWPQLAEHEWIKNDVKISDLTASITEPLTAVMNEEQLKKKKEQQKAKAPPPGTSRILSRATREHKKQQQQQQQQKIAKLPGKLLNETTQQQSNLKKKSIIKEEETKSVIITAKKEDEEWENFAQELNQETNLQFFDKIIEDDAEGSLFIQRLKQRLNVATKSMLDSKMDGASMFRETCRIIGNLISVQFEEEDDDEEDADTEDNTSTARTQKSSYLGTGHKTSRPTTARNNKSTNENQFKKRLQGLQGFCHILEIPKVFSDLLTNFLIDKPSTNLDLLKQQTWLPQIQLDLVVLFQSYFTSHMSLLDQIDRASRDSYLKYAKHFLFLSQHLLNQSYDIDLRLRERTMIVRRFF